MLQTIRYFKSARTRIEKLLIPAKMQEFKLLEQLASIPANMQEFALRVCTWNPKNTGKRCIFAAIRPEIGKYGQKTCTFAAFLLGGDSPRQSPPSPRSPSPRSPRSPRSPSPHSLNSPLPTLPANQTVSPQARYFLPTGIHISLLSVGEVVSLSTFHSIPGPVICS